MVRQSDLIAWLKDVDREDIHLVGEKSANLGEMIQNGFPTPAGFVLTAAAFNYFLKENKLEKPISHLLNSINYSDPTSISQVSGHIKKIIVSAPFPQDMSKQVFRFYERLDSKTHNPSVAIRTSILTQHTTMPATVVPHDSQMNIHGESSVAHAIREVWATLYDAQALQYRHTHQERESTIKTALIIQKMIDADNSGVIFTTHPVTGDKKTMIIEAIIGLGDHLKNRNVGSDQYEIAKEDLTVIKRDISTQHTMLVNANTQLKEVEVPKKLQGAQKISDNLITNISEYAKKLEKHYFFPQDIEWSVEKGMVYIMETRPLMLREKKSDSSTIASPKSFAQSHTLHSMLIGEPGSPGIGVGPVKIVRKVSDVSTFKPGEVFVAESTTTAYEPAMRRASAIIVEKGGRASHAAYVARQFGVPAIVGVPHAHSVLKNGMVLTVKGSSGEILKGNLKLLSTYTPDTTYELKTKTGIYVEIANITHAQRIADLPIDGVGLLSADTIIKSYGVHPKKVLHDKKTHEYTSFMATEIGTIGKSLYPKPVIFALSTGSTVMYRSLQGGKEFEPVAESNPLIGYRGSFRHISDPRMMELELSVVKSVRAFGYNNVHIRIPLVRTLREFEVMKKLIHSAGFRRSATCTVWVTCATIANCVEIDSYIRSGVDGVFIDADMLSQLIVGIDRNNSDISHEINDTDPAILEMYRQVISVCKKKKVPVIFSASYISLTPDLTEKLIEWGVNAISVAPEAVHHTRESVLRSEKNFTR